MRFQRRTKGKQIVGLRDTKTCRPVRSYEGGYRGNPSSWFPLKRTKVLRLDVSNRDNQTDSGNYLRLSQGQRFLRSRDPPGFDLPVLIDGPLNEIPITDAR